MPEGLLHSLQTWTHQRSGQIAGDGGQSGFSMMEAIVATAIAIIAIVGLAHTFGLGRGFVNKFEIARMALGVAQSRMEALSVLPTTTPDLRLGVHPPSPLPFMNGGSTIGSENWRVEPFDDPLSTFTTSDLKLVTVVVTWGQGVDTDSVRLRRLFQN